MPVITMFGLIIRSGKMIERLTKSFADASARALGNMNKNDFMLM